MAAAMAVYLLSIHFYPSACTLPFLSSVFSPSDPFRGSPLPDRAIVIYLRFVDRASISYVSRYEESASLVTRKIEKSHDPLIERRIERMEKGISREEHDHPVK